MYKREKDQLDNLVDEMIELGEDPLEIIDETRSSIIESMTARNKTVPVKIMKLDIYKHLLILE